MSISDSEDHDSKPSAQPVQRRLSTSSKAWGPRGANNNNFNGNNSQLLDGSSATVVVQNMTLSSEQQMELSYQRTVSLLRGAHHDDDDGDSNNVGGNKEIIVMPSLVSLSDDFFKIHHVNTYHNDDGSNDDDLDGSAVPSSAGATILPDLPSINNHRDDRGGRGGQTNHNSSVASVVAAATVGNNNPSSVVPRLRPRLNLRGNNSSSMSSSSDVSMTHDSSSGGGGGPRNIGNAIGMARPRDDHDWPIGPQGAQVPSYLLERLNSDSNDNAGGAQSLEHAFTWWRRGGRKKKNPSMEDVEVGTLTQLAEIMLHPPTEIVEWEVLLEEGRGQGKAMGDNDDVGIDCGSGGGGGWWTNHDDDDKSSPFDVENGNWGDDDTWSANFICTQPQPAFLFFLLQILHKHGGHNGQGAPPGTDVAKAEAAVLGSVHACADWLVDVVQSGPQLQIFIITSTCYQEGTAPPKSPARALGDLGRDGCGLFLVIHSDDIRIGAHSPNEATNALKEFFSKSVSADAGGAVTSGWDPVSGTGGGFYFSGSAGPFPRADNDGRRDAGETEIKLVFLIGAAMLNRAKVLTNGGCVTGEYARGVGLIERSSYTLSVQFLNRISYVTDLVRERSLITNLFLCLYEILSLATITEVPTPVMRDFEAVGTSNLIAAIMVLLGHASLVGADDESLFRAFDAELNDIMNRSGGDSRHHGRVTQNMDGQCWKDYSQPHVERENSAWVGAFNTSISLGSLYERLLKWDDTDPSPINDSVTPVQLLSCAELCYYTLTKGVDRWQRGEILSCRPTPAPSSMKVDHALKSASLPFSTVASAHGTPLAMTALPLSQLEPFSFHLPLHRFAAACAREVCRRNDGSGGLLKLIDKFRVNSNASDEEREKQMRKNDLLFRGMMEFPVIVLSRAAQIRASIWKRNGPGMSDMVLNYSEPPFCRNLQDADIFLVQLALVCMATLVEDEEDEMENEGLSLFSGAGTARLVNLLVHRFGVFSFLGFEMAPSTDLDRYLGEIRSGMYPAEIKPTLPPPPAEDESQHAIEARRRLMREVIHRLASGPKTHSEMNEVSHILSNRDTDVLCELGKKINPDDASGAALEEALNEVGTRKCKSGAPDEWELKESAWSEYDPNFQHISTRAHQHASENRPKQKADAACLPYAPRPLPSHNLFNRLRRDLTSDSTLLACVYRVLHVHCHRPSVVLKDYPGRSMYEADASETVLARAIHLLTLGVYAWDGDVPTGSIDSANWRSQGGDGVASVFVNFDRPPTASDWVEKVLLRNPYEIMRRKEYRDDDGCGEQNILWLLRQVALETQTREQDMSGFLGGLDQSLKSGAMFICNFAAKVNPEASAIVAKHFKVNLAKGNADDLAKRKHAAKEKALAAMKAQMAKFAANLGGDDEDDRMSDAEGSKTSNRDDERLLATPLRQRTDSTGLEAMDLSPHGEFLLTPK
ncbi:E3 ubiquitin-protein ligase [Skeletonema marinoi]|uniref:E3 ubiquitin-protein ligase n=1 Tax=Skeletonema marinoi TaxID=267567 RepID=A0AAD9DBU9_9STRA|nr:E3 ubiquitin-protein ligase [Skeletonema marinoi]